MGERQSVRYTTTSSCRSPSCHFSLWRWFRPATCCLIGAVPFLLDLAALYAMGDLDRESDLHRRLAGLAALCHANGSINVGLIIAATSFAAIVDFGLDFILNGNDTCSPGHRLNSRTCSNTWPVAIAGFLLYTSIVGVLAYTYIAVHTMERSTVLHSGARGSAARRHHSGAAQCTSTESGGGERSPRAGQPLLRDRSRGNA